MQTGCAMTAASHNPNDGITTIGDKHKVLNRLRRSVKHNSELKGVSKSTKSLDFTSRHAAQIFFCDAILCATSDHINTLFAGKCLVRSTDARGYNTLHGSGEMRCHMTFEMP
jgi:hypothetical protein